jgi:hypothetical protein
MPLDPQVLAARIDVRVAELRVLAAKQFLARHAQPCPPRVVAFPSPPIPHAPSPPRSRLGGDGPPSS